MSLTPICRRVLIVTARFPPDGAVGNLRTLRLLKHLAQTGTEQEVLTIAPWTYRSGTVIDSARLDQVPPTVRVIHAPALRPVARLARLLRPSRTRPSRNGKGPANVAAVSPPPNTFQGRLRRLRQAVTAALTLPDPEVSWILPAVLKGFLRGRSAAPDVIYSSGPPFSGHIVASILSALLKKPWVADFRDPWARAPWREDRFAFERGAWSIFERFVVSRADAVVFVTRANRDDFAEHYGEVIARRFHVVSNGCDLSDFDGITPRSNPERFVLLHAGALYGARDPSPLFRAVAACIATGDIDSARFRIRLIGRIGIPGVDLGSLVRELGITDVVEFLPHAPRVEVLQQMVDASALLVVQPVTKVSVPGKLYEYLAARRPILALAEAEGETAAILRQSPAGVVVAPDDEEGLRKALRDLVKKGRRVIDTNPSIYDGARRADEIAAILRLVTTSAMPDTARAGIVSASKQP
ncbi:MAG TPA: glycosyltransferase family 4 protein [Vicinamibacterales bacterium]